MPYSIDVIWISFKQEEKVYKSNLLPTAKHTRKTYFTHDWIFKQSGTDNRVFASANGVKDETFEGCNFGAEINSEINVQLVEIGALGLLKLGVQLNITFY